MSINLAYECGFKDGAYSGYLLAKQDVTIVVKPLIERCESLLKMNLCECDGPHKCGKDDFEEEIDAVKTILKISS